MRKLLHTFFTVLLALVAFNTEAQVSLVTNVTVDAGPYTQGSTIAATFAIGTSGCIARTNTFELYLSDATGSFTSQTLIGSYASFYSTFVNGTIPTAPPVLLPGTGYRVRIRTTSDGLYSDPSNPFEIKLGTQVTAKVTAPAINAANPETFGYCTNRVNPSFFITNQSTAGSTSVTATITNQLTSGAPTVIALDATPKAFTPGAAHYMMFVKVVMPDGSVGTKAYFIINNVANTAFSTTGSGLVCLPLGQLTYGVDIQGTNGIQNNFPGDTYHIDWGDNTQNDYTLCDLKSGIVTHNYTRSSCGSSFNGKFNVFGINISAQSPFCGAIGQPLSTSAKVVTVTENRFAGPLVSCTNSAVTFTNTSLPGQNQDDNSEDCVDNNVTYNWYVNGQIVLSGVPKSTPFVYTFPTAATYEVKLESVSSGTCQGPLFTQNICVQAPPSPAFTLSSNSICYTTGSVTANSSTSVLNNTCSTTPIYTWTVSPSAGVTFTQGSPNPQFTFSQIGDYNISLTIQTVASSPASCEVTTATQRVVVDGPPVATLSGPKNVCAKGNYTFDPNATDTKTVISGNAVDLPGTYTWAVTGGAYTFVGPSTANSKYPTINFADFATYTVTLTYTNQCTTITASQQITFTESPVPTIIAPAQVCYAAPITLQGNITNQTGTTFTWSSTTGGTFTPANDLNTVYTPTAADLANGNARITLTVSTGLQGNCAQVAAITPLITILPNNTGTNATQAICSGNTTSYTPVSSVAGSTFSWTAAVTQGAATGFSAAGSGAINETITNTNPTANAEVTYTITPSSNGCTGVPFTFTVTVTPRPILTATAARGTICSGQPAAISLSSNLGVSTQYSWTSAATNGTTNTVTGNTGGTAATAAAAVSAINDILVNNGTAQGSVTYTITPISATGCPGTPVQVTVLVDPALTVPNAGPDESICNLTTYTLNGNTIAVGTGTWSLTSGQTGVTFDPNNPTTSVSGLIGGQTYTFRWTVSSPGACATIYDETVVTVNIPTVGGTTSGATVVCEAANTGTVTLTGYTGTIVNWQSSIDGGTTWTDIANTNPTLTYTNITASTLYRAVVKNGQCNSEFSSATLITVTPATTIANAGADQVLCNEVTVKLNADPALKAGETAIWTQTAGPNTTTIVNPADPKTTVTGLVPGQTYTFTWTITGNNPCGPTRDDVIITDYPPLTNSIISNSTVVCYNQVVTITGSTPTGGNGTYTYLWEVSTDGTNWNTISAQTGKDLSYQLQATSYFRRTVTSAVCSLVSNIFQIVAQPPITNNTVAANQTICTGVAPAPLTGSTPQGSDGNFNYQWQLSIDNGASWANVQGAVFAAYAPPILTTTTLYRRIVSTITCNGDLQSTSNTVTITVKPNAKAEFTYTTDKACTPFVIDANNVKAVLYPDRNATYTWFADNVQIGTGSTFPGYTINTSNQSVTIKLAVTPSQGCQSDEFNHVFSTNQSVAASFTQSATSGCGPLVVNFVNTSTSLTGATFRWDFGNGTTSSQTMPAAVTFQQDPTGKDTTYTVTLTATTTCGSNSITSTVFVKAKPISVFSPSKTVGCSPMTVTFSNTSPGGTNTYSYDFGDGTLLTKNDKSSVQHTYITNVVRDFVVKMVAQNECGSDVSSYTIRVSPNTVTPELVVNADQKQGCAPFTVNFYNNSKGGNLYKYDFGDGATQLTRSAPEVVAHTFTNPGNYTITLLASNGCSDTTTTETITVLPQPVTSFSADVTLGCPGLVVQFTNTSVDGVSYVWDFGDGTTSNEFAPKHTFTGAQEFYTITLTATNTLGCTGTAIMNQYIHVVPPPIAAFNVAPSTLISIPNYTFRFEDESTNSPTIWAWDFGDGKTSTLKSPSHTYLDTGKYVVTLRVTNQQGCFTTTFKTVTIVGVPGYLYVPNSFMPGSETPELRIFSAKGSGIKTWRMSIFNKWGQQLWETTQLNEGRPVEGWDGTFNTVLQPQGVYFWKIDVEFVNGTAWKGMTYDSSAPKKTGVIHLLR